MAESLPHVASRYENHLVTDWYIYTIINRTPVLVLGKSLLSSTVNISRAFEWTPILTKTYSLPSSRIDTCVDCNQRSEICLSQPSPAQRRHFLLPRASTSLARICTHRPRQNVGRFQARTIPCQRTPRVLEPNTPNKLMMAEMRAQSLFN